MLIPRCQADPNQGIVATQRWRLRRSDLAVRRHTDRLSHAARWQL